MLRAGKDVYNDSQVVDEHPSRGLLDSERKAIEKYFKKSGRVLDLGCALGRTSIILSEMGHDAEQVSPLLPYRPLREIHDKNASIVHRELEVEPRGDLTEDQTQLRRRRELSDLVQYRSDSF